MALSNRNKINDKIFNVDHYHGSTYTQICSLGAYGTAILINNDNIHLTGLNAIEASMYSSFITSILKGLFGRLRPSKTKDSYIFKPLVLKPSYTALPSGHTTSAFAVSTIMAKSVDNLLWDLFWYGAEAGVAASRIYHNRHWLSDTFLGGMIGYHVANYIYENGNSTCAKNRNSNRQYFDARFVKLTTGFTIYIEFPLTK